jgi:ornithine cyclodeaminase/alanine dehydrogenase-like protein (mu-crystallin family)
MVLVLSRRDVEASLSMAECIASQEAAFRAHAQGRAAVPARVSMPVNPHHGLFVAMPARVDMTADGGADAMVAKILTFYDQNPARLRRPAITGVVLVHDSQNGALLAIIDAGSLTALRTAAASGLATRYLARKDTATLAVLGTGPQADAHVDAVLAVRPIREVRVLGRDRARLSTFVDRVQARTGIPTAAHESVRSAVEGADVIVTATSARDSIVSRQWISAGAHINCVGSGIPDRRELDDDTVRDAKIIVDTRESALAEAGDLLIPIARGVMTSESIHAELGEIVTGARPGRESDSEITLFKSVGVALQDAAAAARAYERAIAGGLGQRIEL